MTPEDAARHERRLNRIRAAFRDFGTCLPGVSPEEVAFAAQAASADLVAIALESRPDLEAQYAASYIAYAQTTSPGVVRVEVEPILPPSGQAH